jgi:hypothetical protein
MTFTKINTLNNTPFKNIYYDYDTNKFFNRIGDKDKIINWKTIKSTYQKKNNEFSKFEYKYVYLKEDTNILTLRLDRWLAVRDKILKENNKGGAADCIATEIVNNNTTEVVSNTA